MRNGVRENRFWVYTLVFAVVVVGSLAMTIEAKGNTPRVQAKKVVVMQAGPAEVVAKAP